MEGLVHETCTGISLHKSLHAPLDLRIILRCKRLHHDAHRPDHVIAYMRTAYTFTCSTLEEIRVVLAPDKPAGILVYRVIYIHIPEICHGKQTRRIGVIHKVCIPETVHLESVNLAVFRMLHHSIFLEGGLHLVSKCTALLSQFLILVDLCKYLRSLSERCHSEEIGRHKEIKCSSIIGRSERRDNQSHRIDRIAISVAALGIKLALSLPHEIIRPHSVLPLLLFKCLENVFNSLDPHFPEN